MAAKKKGAATTGKREVMGPLDMAPVGIAWVLYMTVNGYAFRAFRLEAAPRIVFNQHMWEGWQSA